MKQGLIVAVLMLWSVTSFADKRERDLIKKSLDPAVKEAQDKFKASCGCALVITIDPKAVGTLDDIHTTTYMVRGITEKAPKYCTDDASKKAMCQLKSLTMAKNKPANFTFAAGKGVMTHDGQSHATWDQMARVLDK